MTLAVTLALADFADLLPIEEANWAEHRQDEMSGLGSGQVIAATLGPELWTAEVRLGVMYHGEADQVQALVESRGGSTRSFYLYSPRRAYPQADPDGTLLGSNVPTLLSIAEDFAAVAIEGLPAGYVLTRGDFLAFDYGSPAKRALHRVLETVTANGSGETAEFDVWPAIRPGATVSPQTVVTLIKPAAKVFIMPGSFRPGSTRRSTVRGMGFTVMQRL